eukprot:Rmarinus@m.24886
MLHASSGGSGDGGLGDGGGGGGADCDHDGGNLTAALGNTWAHAVNNRLVLDWSAKDLAGENVRVASVAKTPICEAGSVAYKVLSSGVAPLCYCVHKGGVNCRCHFGSTVVSPSPGYNRALVQRKYLQI